jgi:hypothetical protein
MDGRELPRPPRRVPAGAGSLTQLQTSTPRTPEPPRQPWIFGRILAGFLILLLIVAGGATAGWFVRAQSLKIDTPQVLESVGITAEADRVCARSRGPQTGIVPELQVASTPLAVDAQKLLGTYLTLENRHDFEGLQALYSKRLAKTLTVDRDRESHQTSYFFGGKLVEVTRSGVDGANARMTFTVLFSPNAKGSGGRPCNRLDLRYRLIRERGKLVIDQATSMVPAQSCDTD